ncbi:MAG: hypothetical protein IRY95_02855, partial [Clostridia bacterium]|nr:hypothetical protein [Clostridia bacterium]
MSRSATVDVDLVVFDLDGTLYADVAVYRQYTREFARLLGEERRPAFLADVRGALTGTLPAGLGAVYDRQTGLVARPAAAAAAPGGAVHWYTWEGTLVGEGDAYP